MIKIVAVVICLAIMGVFFARYAAISSDMVFLSDKHIKDFGLKCESCHSENPPSKGSQDACIGCHGDLAEVGKGTELTDLPNPHINHNEDLYCDDCHKGHKEPTNFCNQCHEFEFRIP